MHGEPSIDKRVGVAKKSFAGTGDFMKDNDIASRSAIR
jgi:hypothetical protein